MFLLQLTPPPNQPRKIQWEISFFRQYLRRTFNLVKGMYFESWNAMIWDVTSRAALYLLVSRHPLSSIRRQTVRLCSECGKIRIWLAKIGGINLCDTMVEVSLLPAKTCGSIRCIFIRLMANAKEKIKISDFSRADWRENWDLINNTVTWWNNKVSFCLLLAVDGRGFFRLPWIRRHDFYRDDHASLIRLSDIMDVPSRNFPVLIDISILGSVDIIPGSAYARLNMRSYSFFPDENIQIFA